MSEDSYSYLAGLIDGTASVHFLTRKGRQPYPTLRISSRDPKLISHLKQTFGGSTISQKPSKPGYSEKHEWRLDNRQALDALEASLPYVRLANHQKAIGYLLENYFKLTPRNGKYTKEQFEKRQEMIVTFERLIKQKV